MDRQIAVGFLGESAFQFPNIVNVEVFRGECPCSCRHCPVGQVVPGNRANRFGRGDMALDVFERIAFEMSQHVHSTLRIHSVGEPLLWKNILPALDIANHYGLRTWIFTSALTRRKRLLRALVEKSHIVEVSVNDINACDYKAVKGVDGFDLVTQNIDDMWNHIRQEGTGTRLLVSRVQSDPQGDKAFVDHWKGKVHDAFVRSYHTYNDTIENPSGSPMVFKHEPCLVHWARFNINIQGKAVVCFNELFRSKLEPELILGDISSQSIADIWNGDKLNAIRQAELTGEYTGSALLEALPCRTCLYCQPLKGQNQTSEYQVEMISC